MCGIAGFVRNPGTDPDTVEFDRDRIIAGLAHRGPDDHAQYQNGPVWFGHTRLSILDLSAAGNQPMATPDRRFVICYNGEVFNYAEIAKSLDIETVSQSDTEVILLAFAKKGIAAATLFNGMFAFAIHDTELHKVWLVRDRLGIKPLYYCETDSGLAFASEIAPLLDILGASPACDVSSIHEWLYYGVSLGERTLYHGVRKLLPGHYVEIDVASGAVRNGAFWTPKMQSDRLPVQLTGADLVAETRRLLETAVRRQLIADVPIGVLLSGGVDSSAITAFAARHYEGTLATYTAAFDFDGGDNELAKARKVADHFGTDHHELHVSGGAIADVVETMVQHHGSPFSDAANIPLYLLAREITPTRKVVLQGDGGDEIFGGYLRYTTLSYQPLWRPFVQGARFLNSMTPHTAHQYRRQRYLNAIVADDQAMVMALLLTQDDVDSQPTAVFSSAWRAEIEQYDPFVRYRETQPLFAHHDVVNQMALVDTMIILPDIFLEKVDRATMAAGLEARVPFLDHDLVDFCLRVPGHKKIKFGRRKWLLKKALEGVLPDSVIHGQKTGFGVPFGFWLRGALRPLFFDQLETFQARRPGVLDGQRIAVLYDEHVSRRRDRSFLLWKLLNLMIWANSTNVGFTLRADVMTGPSSAGALE